MALVIDEASPVAVMTTAMMKAMTSRQVISKIGRTAIEIEIVLRVQRIADTPDLAGMRSQLPDRSPSIGGGTLERAALTVETTYASDTAHPEHAIEATYEGLYELSEESLADGASSVLDEHFGALGGWIAAMLVRIADLDFTFLPPEAEQ